MVTVKVYNQSSNKLPMYETPGSAGMDVRADFSRITPTNLIKLKGEGEFIFESGPEDLDHEHPAMLRLGVGARVLIPTGLFVKIPEGYEIQVRPRSGLALKQGITVLNTPGTIDSDFIHEIGVILTNQGTESVWIEDGERIAQFVLNQVPQITWEEVMDKSELGKTERSGGFGSTGVE